MFVGFAGRGTPGHLFMGGGRAGEMIREVGGGGLGLGGPRGKGSLSDAKGPKPPI